MKKYTNELKRQILLAKSKDESNRSIAKRLGVSEAGIRGFLKSAEPENTPVKVPKILIFDLETSAALVYAFGRKKQFHTQNAIKREGGKILCAAYCWLGDKESTVLVNKEDIKQDSDYWICEQLYDLVSEADAIVAFNGKFFDFPVLQTRLLANGFPATHAVHEIDPCLIAKKKFRFPDRKLDTVAAYLGVGRKVSTTGIDLWVRVQEGDEQALLDMVEYCKNDNEILRDVFLELRSRGLVSGFNAGVYVDSDSPVCNVCSSTNVHKTDKFVTTPAGKFEEYQCEDCGNISRGRINLLSSQQKKNLLVPIKR